VRLTFHKPAIYLITKGESTAANFDKSLADILKIIEVAITAGVPLIQLREKNLPAKMLVELSLRVVSLTRGSLSRVLINDRADVALAAGADGVHLTANSIAPRVIRANFPPDFIIGVSAHSLAEAKAAADGGADFAVFGPVFTSPGKGDPQGIEKLKEICDRLNPFPVFGLGGVDESNLDEVIAAGAQGVAAIRSLNDPMQLRKLAAALST